MRVPTMTAEYAIGPARGTYAAPARTGAANGVVPAGGPLQQAAPGVRAQIEAGTLPNPCGQNAPLPCWGEGSSQNAYRCCEDYEVCHVGLGKLPFCIDPDAAPTA